MRKVGVGAAAVLVSLVMCSSGEAQSVASCSWMDTNKTPEQRATEFVAAATDTEKVLLTATTFSFGEYFGLYGRVAENPRLCFPGLSLSDGGAGVAALGLPLITGVTAFPAVSSQASSWDRNQQVEYAQVLAAEHRGKGNGVIYNPAFNIVRAPLGGRTFEYMGEDPFLAGEMGLAMTRGIQRSGLIAQAKHFALNSQETDRNMYAVESLPTIDHVAEERVIRESELPAFEKVVKGGIGSVMCSYNKINGTQACANSWLLNDVLKGEWGFDGFVASDYGAARTQKTINAGMDFEQNLHQALFLGPAMLPLVVSGEVRRERLNDMARRVVTPMFRIGLFDNPPDPQPTAYNQIVTSDRHRAMARRVAVSGTVLLKNEREALPLARGKKIVVLGRGAIDPNSNPRLGPTPMGGGGSSQVYATDPIYPCEGMQALAPKYEATITCDGTTDPAAAAALAKDHDVAVVFAYKDGAENADVADYTLPDTPLIEAVSTANRNTIVVLQTGNSVEMPWLAGVPAVLQGWLAGEQFGNAFAEVLFGEEEPGGRLPLSFLRKESDGWLRTDEQFPGVGTKVTYSEGLFWGYRWFDQQGIEPEFAFGHGLSYTTWAYSDLTVKPTDAGAEVSYTVRNTGSRTGSDVSQVYVGFPTSAGEPPRQLKGFEKVRLAPGESRRVTVSLDARAFQIWDDRKKDWSTVPGCYAVDIARSSRDLQLNGQVARNGGRCSRAEPACASRRVVTLNVRGISATSRVRSVSVFVDGKRVTRRRGGGRAVTVRFGGRRRSTVRLRIVATTTSGRRVVDRRTYRLCVRKET